MNEWPACQRFKLGKISPRSMSVIAILFVDQKCSKKASISIHVINLGVWDLN